MFIAEAFVAVVWTCTNWHEA